MHLRYRDPAWLLICGQVFLRYEHTESAAFIWCGCTARDEAFCLPGISDGAVYAARLKVWMPGLLVIRPQPARYSIVAVRMLLNITTVFE